MLMEIQRIMRGALEQARVREHSWATGSRVDDLDFVRTKPPRTVPVKSSSRTGPLFRPIKVCGACTETCGEGASPFRARSTIELSGGAGS